jgi:hypothetical protein
VRGTGVAGQSTSGDAVLGTSTSLAGVHGLSTTNNGVFGDSEAALASGVYGQNDGGGYGVAGRLTKLGLAAVLADAGSTGSDALEASSPSGAAVDALSNVIAVEADSSNSNGGAKLFEGRNGTGLEVFNVYTSGQVIATSSVAGVELLAGSNLFEGNSNAANVFNVDTSGNVHGHSFTADLAASTGQKLVTYAPQASEPTIEDFGEAQLTNGAAYVRLDQRFATTIARGSNYLVFITPEGDNRGLFVTQKSALGFAVRESQGGHSTLAFSYRIVAKPFGNASPRLPNYTTRKEPMPRAIR